MQIPSGRFFAIEDLEHGRSEAAKLYYEFLRIAAMSAGIYVLSPGAADRQQPHKEDELYYVVRGRARMKITGEDTEQDEEVKTGSVIFVAKNTQHHFYQIVEELLMLVFFAPAESE